MTTVPLNKGAYRLGNLKSNIRNTSCYSNMPIVGQIPQGDKIKILLMGKTGNGKSATGNTILSGFGEEVELFKSTGDSKSVTSTVDKVSKLVNGRHITVVDTPGTCDTSQNDDRVLEEIAGAIEKCTKGYDVFVLVMRYGNRLTKEEKSAVTKLEQLFGPEIYKYTILVFTDGNSFHRSQRKNPVKISFAQHIMRDADSSDDGAIGPLVKRFGGIAVLFDNHEDDPDKRGQMVAELVQRIDEVRAKNGEKCYDRGIFEYARKLKTELKAKNVPKPERRAKVIQETKKEAKRERGCTIL